MHDWRFLQSHQAVFREPSLPDSALLHVDPFMHRGRKRLECGALELSFNQ